MLDRVGQSIWPTRTGTGTSTWVLCNSSVRSTVLDLVRTNSTVKVQKNRRHL
eukprot:COSAG02_NODE_51661_length_312_cov_1.549296_1_plen_51_part_10